MGDEGHRTFRPYFRIGRITDSTTARTTLGAYKPCEFLHNSCGYQRLCWKTSEDRADVRLEGDRGLGVLGWT